MASIQRWSRSHEVAISLRILQRQGARDAAAAADANPAIWCCREQSLVDVLAAAAQEAGVEIATNSQIVSAEPGGAPDQRARPALRCRPSGGCDGFRSKVRDSLNVGAAPRVGTLINRYLVPPILHDRGGHDRALGLARARNRYLPRRAPAQLCYMW